MLKVVESSKLNLESCRMLKLLNVESCQMLKVVESCKFANCKNLFSTNKLSKAFILYTIWYINGGKEVKNFEKSYIPKEILRVRVFYSS